MKFSKEYIESIIINLISNVFWCILSGLFAASVGSVPVLVFNTDLRTGIILASIILLILLALCMKFRNKLLYVKWNFFIKTNTYELKLHENGTACFSQKFNAKICSKEDCKLLGSYDWSDAETITNAQVESRFANWTLSYKAKNESTYTTITGDRGTKSLPATEKEIDYIIEYEDSALSKSDVVENETKVDFTYNKANLTPEFFAGIKHRVGVLDMKLYVPDRLVKSVKFYVKTFLGKEYIINHEKSVECYTDGAGKYYGITIKKPKLFCKYIIKWEWV